MAVKLSFSREEYQARVNRAIEVMDRDGTQALIAFANKVMPGHVRYLTGYETRHGVHDCCFFVIVPGPDPQFTLLTNVSWEEHRQLTWVNNVIITSIDKFGSAMADLLPEGVKTIGIAGYNYFPAPVYRRLVERFPTSDIWDVSNALLDIRKVKSLAEIAVLKRCAEITDAGARAFLAAAQEGRSEREILVQVESALKLNGSDEVSFITQVGRGPRTAAVCMYPTDQVLMQGDLVQLDCGATYLGYRGDISRIAVVGKPSSRQRLLLDVTAEMYYRMLDALRPGALASEIAKLGVDIASSHGLKDNLYRSPNVDIGFMGHGIGCGFHESPELALNNHTEIQENMVIVLEPILSEKGVGGVKIEDAVLVTSKGAERFSTCEIRTWQASD